MHQKAGYALLVLLAVAAAVISFQLYAEYDQKPLISLFPLEHYSQNIADWIKPDAADYNAPLLSEDMQKKRLEIYFKHYYGSYSPWDEQYVTQLLQQDGDSIQSIEQALTTDYSNEDKPANEIGYAENFHPYPPSWIKQIIHNINAAQFQHQTYHAENRAIAVDNLAVRVLPTTDVHFFSYQLAGQGYPFDNLQISALWAGTPVYVLGLTRDKAWSLIISPDFIGWVQTKGLAYTSTAFVTAWEKAAKNKMAAITKTQTPVIATDNTFLFSAYVGTVLPALQSGNTLRLLVPAANAERQAVVKFAEVTADEAVIMPLPFTRHHVADILHTLINRPYGWGGLYFYNDCSAELKSLFTPFGIWLPRHSSDQVTVSKMVDMTAYASEERLHYLMQNGKAFITIIYIGGHIVLYIGNYPNPNSSDHAPIAMTYQNMWGLSPAPPNRRAVIGQSVIFPMLLQFPEDTSLHSQADKHYFEVAYLDQLPNEVSGLSHQTFDIKAMMMPDG